MRKSRARGDGSSASTSATAPPKPRSSRGRSASRSEMFLQPGVCRAAQVSPRRRSPRRRSRRSKISPRARRRVWEEPCLSQSDLCGRVSVSHRRARGAYSRSPGMLQWLLSPRQPQQGRRDRAPQLRAARMTAISSVAWWLIPSAP